MKFNGLFKRLQISVIIISISTLIRIFLYSYAIVLALYNRDTFFLKILSYHCYLIIRCLSVVSALNSYITVDRIKSTNKYSSYKKELYLFDCLLSSTILTLYLDNNIENLRLTNFIIEDKLFKLKLERFLTFSKYTIFPILSIYICYKEKKSQTNIPEKDNFSLLKRYSLFFFCTIGMFLGKSLLKNEYIILGNSTKILFTVFQYFIRVYTMSINTQIEGCINDGINNLVLSRD